MKLRIEFSEEKNLILREARGVCFDDVLAAIEKKKVLDDLQNKKYPHQRLLVVEVKGYVYGVPYVLDKKKRSLFLKTVYPSRKLMKSYQKGVGR